MKPKEDAALFLRRPSCPWHVSVNDECDIGNAELTNRCARSTRLESVCIRPHCRVEMHVDSTSEPPPRPVLYVDESDSRKEGIMLASYCIYAILLYTIHVHRLCTVFSAEWRAHPSMALAPSVDKSSVVIIVSFLVTSCRDPASSMMNLGNVSQDLWFRVSNRQRLFNPFGASSAAAFLDPGPRGEVKHNSTASPAQHRSHPCLRHHPRRRRS